MIEEYPEVLQLKQLRAGKLAIERPKERSRFALKGQEERTSLKAVAVRERTNW